jgi:hypothetical protein
MMGSNSLLIHHHVPLLLTLKLLYYYYKMTNLIINYKLGSETLINIIRSINWCYEIHTLL